MKKVQNTLIIIHIVLIIILFGVLASQAQRTITLPDYYYSKDSSDYDTAWYDLSTDSLWYSIRFTYNSGYCTIPMTYPPGPPHYDAVITVFAMKDKKWKKLKEFEGTYTKMKCYEDDLDEIIKMSYNIIEK